MIVPTRTICYADGRREVIRVLNEISLEEWKPDDPLAFESSLVWNFAVESLDFVRVRTVPGARSRRGPLELSGNHILVGYSKLSVNAPCHPQTRRYARRVFYLEPEDMYRNLIEIPPGAVDPATLLPGCAGSPPDIRLLLKGYPAHSRRGCTFMPVSATAATGGEMASSPAGSSGVLSGAAVD
ncbi:MAG: hypothetical protein KatS3mg082_2033 [Nitrospiraceae bacterium]|nr:MAG: hypothetical protein KatS3mg082_2033 [Nitrospiraceae bacterium]